MGIILRGFVETIDGVRREVQVPIENIPSLTDEFFFYGYRETETGIRHEVRIPAAAFYGWNADIFVYGYIIEPYGAVTELRLSVAAVVDEGGSPFIAMGVGPLGSIKYFMTGGLNIG